MDMIKMFQIQPDKGCNSHIESTLKDAITSIEHWLDDADEGVELTVKVIKMSRDEYDSLPEYMGP